MKYYNSLHYCNSLNEYKRRETNTVNIGDLCMGSAYPIRVQSMTTTDTMDTQKTVEQSIRMIDAGCELVRITAPSIHEARNLEKIKNELKSRGYNTPICADIHFTPNAAEIAARIVEKVRINPGNFADKKKFEILEYTDADYQEELDRIRQKFAPLVKICKEYGTAMRIGTNHGSLSDRIMNRFGDSPEGMVESALEFLRIAESENYFNIVLSMKSSNPIVMIHAYRLLVNKMEQEGMKYPLHLGVTEAGEAEEGRIKSAIGIGSLLASGIGDTIRVSLTEDPEFEIPVAKKLVKIFEGYQNHQPIQYIVNEEDTIINPFQYQKSISSEIGIFGGKNVPRVVSDYSLIEKLYPSDLLNCDYRYDPISDKWNQGDLGADFLYTGSYIPDFMLPNGTKLILDYQTWNTLPNKENTFPLIEMNEFSVIHNFSNKINFLLINTSDKFNAKDWLSIKSRKELVLVLQSSSKNPIAEIKNFIIHLKLEDILLPIILKFEAHNMEEMETFILESSLTVGSIFAEGMGDGVWLKVNNPIESKEKITNNISTLNRTSFNILQAVRQRISRAEYISCPSCGRTLFDLQETTAMIRKETDHLKGVKIAIMGCIVNGPGEMADADFGYVGTGEGKITLYRGKDVVKRNINAEFALQELINLIKENGQWIEREVFA